MSNFIITTLLSAIAFVIGAKFMSNVEVRDFWAAIGIALVTALLNSTIGSAVKFLGTPINWITLGLFSFIVDAALILLASKLLKGFYVKDFWTALGLAFLVALINWCIHTFTGL